jgi:hypothetical protein
VIEACLWAVFGLSCDILLDFGSPLSTFGSLAIQIGDVVGKQA